MSRRFYVETSTSGKNQFVSIKRSRSHGHHHHKHHSHKHETYYETQDYYKVRVDEWNRIKERERCLQDANGRLADEVKTLKASLAAAQEKANNLGQVVVPQLEKQVGVLTTDNEALRKSLEDACNSEGRHCREEDKLKQTVERLEKEKKEVTEENGSLKEENRSLKDEDRSLKDEDRSLKEENRSLKEEYFSLKDKMKLLQRQGRGRCSLELLREIDYWYDQYRYWKGKYDDAKRVHDDVCVTLEIRTEKMRAYEEILKRRRII